MTEAQSGASDVTSHERLMKPQRLGGRGGKARNPKCKIEVRSVAFRLRSPHSSLLVPFPLRPPRPLR